MPHVLSHNKGGEYPREVIVMDTETREIPLPDGATGHVLVFGWAFHARRTDKGQWQYQQWFRFETKAEFWRWALSWSRKKSKLTIYCHNAEFDAQVVDAFAELRRRRWKLINACLEGPPTIIRWRRGTKTVLWLDTLNLWRVPLAAIGEKVGLPKLTMPKEWKGRKCEDTYCKRDVKILWRALLSWWSFLLEHDLGTAAPTLAGQAFSSYRHRFMPVPIFIDANADALALARQAYLGGRCECFYIGAVTEPLTVLDVNSMYPFVMRELEAPTRLLTIRSRATLPELDRYRKTYALVADVTLSTERPAFPHVVDGRLCFPVGTFRQVLATPELNMAMDAGCVVALHRVAIYERAVIFRDFVDWAYATRLKARADKDTLLDWQVKIMANSLYGKFGQRGKQWDVVAHASDYKVESLTSFDLNSGQWKHVRQIGTAIQELHDVGESLNSHPAIAAHVTSAARAYLWTLITTAGVEHVKYMDTDSLVVDRVGASRLGPYVSGTRLGSLKRELQFDCGEIRGPKDYQFGNKRRIKGVRSDAQTSDGQAFAQLQWQGWQGAIARGRLDLPVTREVVKVLAREYTKGNVTQTGVVEPLRLLG